MGTHTHTPGPWVWLTPLKELNSAHGKIFDYAYYEGMWFAAYNQEQDEANARLIAAAPDLLDACRIALAMLNRNLASEESCGQPFNGDDEHETHSALTAVIAKATQP